MIINRLRVYNYHDWYKTITLYLHSIDKDDHMIENTPQGEESKVWLLDDARLFLQIRNSIEEKVLGLINHCETVKELMEYLEFLYYGKKIYPVQQQQRQMVVMSFLAGLPPEFEYSKSQILTIFEEFSLADVFSRVICTEQSPTTVHIPSELVIKVTEQPQIVPCPPIVQSPGPHAIQRTEYRHPRRANTNGIGVVCHYCHKLGHLKSDCRKLQY
ncbi:hypothetical protein LIER_37895 [Lithospermum erythrorhizon]|uniref:CCHC-type domain-containing protein n=1 Tax=Lithospermum erythrorhizon TaxID=34254 RepID=A0AAV3PRY0_LITER